MMRIDVRRRWVEFQFILGLLSTVLAAASGQQYTLSDKDEITKSFRLSESDNRRLVVDNINGTIKVTGYNGETIELVAHKEIKAESGEKVDEARRDVKLEIKQETNKLILYVDAPWRNGDGTDHKGWRYYGYDVIYNFELRVPRKICLYLKTINHGEIIVHNVEGECEISNVNAGIEMTDMNGPAQVSTVNGPINVSFSRNPVSECSFKTVNGKIEVKLQSGLNADVKLKTFNGSVYSDFDIIALPRDDRTLEEHKGSRRIYRRGSSSSVRVGNGGPQFSFETLNGNIYILKQD
jgi:hypothetical protein